MVSLSSQEIEQVSGGVLCPCLATACALAAAGASTSAAAYTANIILLYATSAGLFLLAGYYGYSHYSNS